MLVGVTYGGKMASHTVVSASGAIHASRGSSMHMSSWHTAGACLTGFCITQVGQMCAPYANEAHTTVAWIIPAESMLQRVSVSWLQLLSWCASLTICASAGQLNAVQSWGLNLPRSQFITQICVCKQCSRTQGRQKPLELQGANCVP